MIDSDQFNQPPPSINSANSAFRAFAYLAKTWSPPHIATDLDGKKELWIEGKSIEVGNRGPQDFNAECDALDQQISRFIAGNPGAVEALLLDKSYQDLLALTRAGGEEPYFSVLMKLQTHASPARGELLWRTLRACDPAAILRCLSDSVNRHRVLIEKGSYCWGVPWQLMSSLAGWLGPKRYGQLRTQVKPLELQDALMFAAQKGLSDSRPVAAVHFKLPEILPPTEIEIVEMGPQEVSRRIAEYKGCSVEDLHALLRANNFLAHNDQLGEVIVKDAKTLLRLGVSRLDLAAKLRSGIDQFNIEYARGLDMLQADPSTVTATGATRVDYTFGHHQDPFHSVDTYYLSEEVGGSADCSTTRGTTVVLYSDMHPYLIRRACFFEGNVSYRLEPQAICEALGLV